jgi:glycosyltransferase involved in cell wall biosynthesis
MNPLVSIIIPTHNRGDLLHRSVNSALQQTYSDVEIIIVDDHSVDHTKEVVCEYMEKNNNVYYYCLPSNLKGACAARNYGIEKSNGEYIAGLDDDDEFMPNRIELLMTKMKPDYAFVFSSWVVCKLGKFHSKNYFRNYKIVDQKEMLWCNYVGNQILVAKTDIIQAGRFDLNISCCQDWDMWLRLLKIKNKALYIPVPLQIIYVDYGRESITKTANYKEGLDVIYQRNFHLMSFWQKHFFQYIEYRRYGKSLSIMTFVSCIFYCFVRIKQLIIIKVKE